MRQRELFSKKAFLSLPKEEQEQLARQLLRLLSSEYSPIEPRKAATDTKASREDLSASEAI